MTFLLSRSLGARIVAVALLNLALLVGLALVAAGVRLPASVADLLLQASTDRILDVSRQVALAIQRAPARDADVVLSGYEQQYRARFVLATNDGVRVAGAALEIPSEVVDRLGRGGPEPPDPGAPRFRPMFDRRARGPLPLPEAPPFLMTSANGPRYWLGVRVPIQHAESSTVIPGTLLIVANSLVATPLLFPVQWVLWGLAALGLSIACWWPLLRGLTANLRKMAGATAGIAEGKFAAAASLDVRRTDEVGRLARAISQMATRLDALVTGQKRFLSDTAHELRSPLARLQVALELVEREASDRAKRYVEDAKADVDAMGELTSELLQYARATMPVPAAAELLSLKATVQRVVAREAPVATNVHIDVPDGLMVTAEAGLLERAIANVLRNALRHAGAGRIDMTATANDGCAILTVADEGPGVSAESLPRLFEPFYRVDAARSRDAGGVGLGLAIVRSAAEAMGGTVIAENGEPRGLRVLLRLPLAAAIEAARTFPPAR